jgi:hypothetical protein
MTLWLRLQQLWCRHEDILRMDDTSMWLECLACGRTTHGFTELGARTYSPHTSRTASKVEWLAPAAERRAA